jgi:predicted metal-dependent hydrolase
MACRAEIASLEAQMTMEQGVLDGIHLFNTRNFFEAHEALEAVWLKAKGHRKTLLHGLIQVAAAFHHHTRRNPAGFRSLLEKGCTKLERFGAEAEGLDLAGLMLELRPWREHLDRSSHHAPPAPPLPRLKLIVEPSSD